MKKWTYYTPNFECDDLNSALLKYAPWSGHRNFVYDFMDFLRPARIAELGSHYGCSAFTFCQADKDFSLNTDMYFIDTWQGDDFTKKYNNDVYAVFTETVKKFYSEQKINMLRMTFDEALDKFEDKSLDLIHIDGSHHYDDVKHDFESWFPKVKENGVILLHDISSDIVLGDTMGSYKFWQELKADFKYCADFDFSWGLGIIFLSENIYNDFINAVDISKYQRINNALDVGFKDVLRQNYFSLQDKQIYIDDLLEQKKVMEEHLKAYKTDTDKKNEYISELETRCRALCDEKDAVAKEYEERQKNTVADFELQLRNTIKDYETSAAAAKTAYESTIADIKYSYENTIHGKDEYINELENKINGFLKDLEEKNAAISELENYKTMYEKTFTGKVKEFCNKAKNGKE